MAALTSVNGWHLTRSCTARGDIAEVQCACVSPVGSLKITPAVDNGRILGAGSTRLVIADDCPQAHFSSIVLRFLQKPAVYW